MWLCLLHVPDQTNVKKKKKKKEGCALICTSNLNVIENNNGKKLLLMFSKWKFASLLAHDSTAQSLCLVLCFKVHHTSLIT